MMRATVIVIYFGFWLKRAFLRHNSHRNSYLSTFCQGQSQLRGDAIQIHRITVLPSNGVNDISPYNIASILVISQRFCHSFYHRVCMHTLCSGKVGSIGMLCQSA